MLILICRIGNQLQYLPGVCRISSYTYVMNGALLDLLELIVDLLDQLECFIFSLSLSITCIFSLSLSRRCILCLEVI